MAAARWPGVQRVVRSPRWIIVAVHAGIVASPVIFAGSGFPDDMSWRGLLVTVPLGAALLAFQLPISFAVARGERPSHLLWRLLGLAATVYAPLPWTGVIWLGAEVFLVASLTMIVPRRLGPAVVVLALLWREGLTLWGMQGASTGLIAFNLFYSAGWMLSLVAALVGAVWLVQTLDALHASRAQLARVAVERERLRLSRDLHDLLGQSLSAVSLKGDLALRLLHTDRAAARTEIEGLTTIAREALHGIRAITSDRHAVSLQTEIDSASNLLSAAGIAASIGVDVPGLTPAAEEVLAWAIREGVTNMLRHSDARTCAITAVSRNGAVRLEMINDVAHRPSDEGSGLAGLSRRAAELSGSVATERSSDGRFRLVVEIPREAS